MRGRNMLVIVSIVAVAAIAVAIAATAASGQSTPTSSRPKTITVTATATVDSTPDEAMFDLSVRSDDTDSAAAFAQNATDMKAVLDALKKAGVASDDIQTLNVTWASASRTAVSPTSARCSSRRTSSRSRCTIWRRSATCLMPP